MRALVTGISGFVGLELASALIAEGCEVAGTYINEPPDLPGVDLHEADLLDLGALAAAVAKVGPEVIVHLAGLSHVGESWKRMGEYFQVNLLGTENVLSAAGATRVVFASSAEVYGLVPESEQPIAETRRPAPRSPYGLTKAAAERLALGAGATVARSFNVVGPGQADLFALPAFAAQLAAVARGEQPPVLQVGNLEARRDFLHVADAAAAYVTLSKRGEAGTVYNLGSGNAWSIGEGLRLLVQASGLDVEIHVDPERFRPVDVSLLQADASKLRALGWKPERGFDQAVADLWRSVRP